MEKTGYRTFLGNNGNYMEYWSRGVGLPLVDKKLDGTADVLIADFKVRNRGLKKVGLCLKNLFLVQGQ